MWIFFVEGDENGPRLNLLIQPESHALPCGRGSEAAVAPSCVVV